MSCPFYDASLFHGQLIHMSRVQVDLTGNRCALITSSHSPCWMEVGESRPADWAQCPRNPEFQAVAVYENLHSDVVSGRMGDARLLASLRHLNRLIRMRVAGEQ